MSLILHIDTKFTADGTNIRDHVLVL